MIRTKNSENKHTGIVLSDFSLVVSLNFLFYVLAGFIFWYKFKKAALQLLTTVENQVYYFAFVLRQAIFHELFVALVSEKKLLPEYLLPQAQGSK